MALEQLVIDGTGDSQPLLRQLGKAFEAANPGTKIIVPESIGSSGGVKSLINGKCDMARIARPLKKKELDAGKDLIYHQFAYSPVVFTANHPEQCIDNLTTDQVVQIFSGAINDWSALGNCRPHKIYVAMRETGDSSRSVIEKNLPGFKEIAEFTGKTVYSTPETVMTLEEHPYTISFLPQGSITSKLLVFNFNGVAPTEAAVKQGDYPLFSPFGLVWRGELSNLGSQFLKYLSSPAAIKIIRELGVIPVTDQR